jgi:hypothetical protein
MNKLLSSTAVYCKNISLYEIWGFQGEENMECGLLSYEAVQNAGGYRRFGG